MPAWNTLCTNSESCLLYDKKLFCSIQLLALIEVPFVICAWRRFDGDSSDRKERLVFHEVFSPEDIILKPSIEGGRW